MKGKIFLSFTIIWWRLSGRLLGLKCGTPSAIFFSGGRSVRASHELLVGDFILLVSGLKMEGGNFLGDKNKTRIPWHPAFYGGIELELREYRDELEFKREYNLSKEPLKMDLLVIKKRTDAVIENPIAEIFREYNIVEYKSPEDGLNIDDLYKTIGYACLYKGLTKKTGIVSADEITVSVFRDKKPLKLLRELEKSGKAVEKSAPGVYHVGGIIEFPLQIIVVSELEEGKHNVLKILKPRASETDIKRFLDETSDWTDRMDIENISAVLAASIVANRKLFREVTNSMVLDAEARRDIRIILGEEEEFQRLQAELDAKSAELDAKSAELDASRAENERLKRMLLDAKK